MKWYHDNGKLTLLILGVFVLIFILIMAGCNSCLQGFWEVGNSPQEKKWVDSLENLKNN